MMIPYLRKKKIVEILGNEEIFYIDDFLNHIEGISKSTLRRDLKDLEDEDVVVFLKGGAVKLKSQSLELPVSTKLGLQKKEKDIIAKTAASYISDGDVIYIDSGTTCTSLMKYINNKDITVVTSNTALLNGQYEHIKMYIIGGEYNSDISSVNGPIAENNLRNFNFDKAFIGTSYLDVSRGITTPNIHEANKKKIVISRSKKNYVLCDSSKFHKSALCFAFGVEECTVISDKYDEKIAKATEFIVAK